MSALLETVIATRRLRFSVKGKTKTLTVKIGVPKRVQTGEWACPYRIGGLKDRTVYIARGVDAVQALVLAFEAIRLRLKALEGRVSWSGERGGGEFPQYVPTYLGPEVTRRIEKLIERELDRAGRALKAKYERENRS